MEENNKSMKADDSTCLDKDRSAEEIAEGTAEETLMACLKDNYVCWLDVMGMQKTMSRSLAKAMNFMLKFHNGIVEALQNSDVKCYPLMDGVYLAAEDLEQLKNVINAVYARMAHIAFSRDPQHCFVIRGAIAKGTILHGRDLREKDLKFDCAKLLQEGHVEQLMMGMPIIQAYLSERNAPPFGVYIHESARVYGDLQGCYYYWWHEGCQVNIQRLADDLNRYFAWCGQNKYQLEMDEHKIRQYEELVAEYFNLSNKPKRAFKKRS